MDQHEKDYDRGETPRNSITEEHLTDILEQSLEIENEMMRTYLITAERIHDDGELKDRLQNFAEGNAKRTRQLKDEIERLKEDS
ncbi:hypothetical protein [Ectobacillus ponti]|uniref:Uncharacterized protein n=1 Tax=Ectobacillus ponti TaxID=2961894 RepID=A0AA42BQ69_9BACI|nr:hypothetical protein [Ectobacillus ponti]MCP8969552.1 hypothetical protein [Ectobacillus ponti]